MEARKTASKSCLRRALTLLALLPAVTACGPEQQLPEPLGVAKHEARATSETMTPALRAAYIANVQATASHDYALKTKGDVLKAHNAAQRFDVEMGEVVSVRLPGDERLSFDLAGVGCDGELRAVGKAAPAAAGYRVEYVRRGGEADDLTEWYVHGPLGLEQGFTLDRPVDCGTRDVVLDVGVGGSLTPSIGAQGKAVLLRNPVGRAVARYSDLYVVDAAGHELPSKLEVVGRSVRIRFDERAAVYPVRVDPLVAVEQAKLLASDGKAEDYFGRSVDVSGDTAVIGSPGASAAYVFRRTEDTWAEEAKLVTSDLANLGDAVAIFGDTIVVGDKYDDLNGPYTGAAYVFGRAAGVWSEQAKLVASDGKGSDSFGYAVGVFEDTIVVGAATEGGGVGAVYVFTGAGGTWIEQAKLLPSDPQVTMLDINDHGTELGTCVALSGDTVVGCARTHNEAGLKDAGAAYVFVRSGGVWAEQAKLVASNFSAGAGVGASVGLSGDTVLLAGDVLDPAYVFVRSGVVWAEQAILHPSDSPNAFGPGVDVSGNMAVIGMDGARPSGAAYLYERTGDTWLEQQKIEPSDGDPDDLFGGKTSLSDDTLIVGAVSVGDLGWRSGAACAFALRLPQGSPCVEGSECASTFCIDGVCCDAPCDGATCEACTEALGASADGTCTALTGPACDDGNACTQLDACQDGQCVGESPVSCPPTDACHDNCNPTTGQCAEIAKPDETPCDDGNACTQQDTCQAGVCTAASATSCTALDECHEAGACDPTTGVCDNPARQDGTPCSLGTCQAGECEPQTSEGPVYVVEGGCGCKASRSPDDYGWPGFMVAAVLAALRRRRASFSGVR